MLMIGCIILLWYLPYNYFTRLCLLDLSVKSLKSNLHLFSTCHNMLGKEDKLCLELFLYVMLVREGCETQLVGRNV